MNFLSRLVFFLPMIFIGMPLFSLLSRNRYFHIEEKYMPIRPTDVWVHMALCGWATTLSVLVTVAVWIFSNTWVALVGLLVMSIITLFLIRVVGKLILDYALKYE